jgi:hypothetical protein
MAYLRCENCKIGLFYIRDYYFDFDENVLLLLFVCNECSLERVLKIEFSTGFENEEEE